MVEGEDDDALVVFDVADLDGSTGIDTHATGDAIGDTSRPPGPPLLERWPWWCSADRISRCTAAVAAGLLAVAVVLGVAAARTEPQTRELTVQRVVAPTPTALDAIGCPGTRLCAVRAVAASRLAQVPQVIASGRVVASAETFDATAATVYRRTVTIRATDTTIRLAAQCVPGAGPVTAVPMTLTVTTGTGEDARSVDVPAGQDAPPGVRHLGVTLPGPDGCSISAQAVSELPSDLLDGLPLDYELQLLAGVVGLPGR